MMLVSRSNRIGSALLPLRKRLLQKHLASSFQAEPVKYERKTGSIGPTKKSFKEPFLKNVLTGKFDTDVLIYPEVVDLEVLQQRIIQDINIEPDKEGRLIAQLPIQDRVKSFCKAGVPLMSDADVNESARAKICEFLNVDLETALLMETQSFVVHLISKFGSEQLKTKYLTRLIRGEITGAYAMSESSSGSDPSTLCTSANPNAESGYFLTGEKEWVSNGQHADIYLIFATSESLHGGTMKDVSVYIVEKQFKGVTLFKQTPFELENCGFCKIKLDQTPVPAENLLGECGDGFRIGSESMCAKRYFILSSFLNSLKATLREVNEYISTRHQLHMPLKDRELIQIQLAEISMSIYALESMIYLYTGLIDNYDIDVDVESASLQLFCYETVLNCLNTCNEILGGKSYNADNHYMKMIGQVRGLILASKTKSLLQLYISMNGLRHAAIATGESVLKSRNPLNYPLFILKHLVSNSRNAKDEPKLNLQIFLELHPSLKQAADLLEYTVHRLKYAVDMSFSRYGTDIVNKQKDLSRIADVLVDIFAMTAVLSRASRSYCTGIRFCDQESLYANSICLRAMHRIKTNINQIVDGGITSTDVNLLKVGVELLNQKEYFIEHPLVRNIK